MHVATHTALVVTALVAALVLVMPRGDRLYPGIAALGALIETLIVFHAITISVKWLRMDLLLGGMVLVGGGIAWGRASGKTGIAAATVVTMIGAMQVLAALDVLR
jgi:hypothetical protein